MRLSATLVHKIPKEHVELGVGVPDQVWSVKNATVGRLGALHSLALKVPAATTQVGAAPDAHVVVWFEPTMRGGDIFAAVVGWVCTLAVLSTVHPPRTFEPAHGTIMRIHYLALGVQTWACVVDDNQLSRS